ncbi:hypothetical protein HW555_012131 [Spodoptera exigua]|uniref:Uncharacterized protein n=1 Tax=Spodoptera exigua TaxID=7107 RepID=A0A835G7P8_SPOEX|nr:hypothetical protein HW555_012131 [Spodoptera exigua]
MNSDELVLTVGEDQLMSCVEEHAGDIVVVATARVHLPSLRLVRCSAQWYLSIVHPPEFDLSVVSGRYYERQAWVEGGPVHSSVVALQDMFDDSISLQYQLLSATLRSVACGFLKCSARPVGPGATLFFLRPEKSHTLTD